MVLFILILGVMLYRCFSVEAASAKRYSTYLEIIMPRTKAVDKLGLRIRLGWDRRRDLAKWWIGQGVGVLIRDLDMLGWEFGCEWVPDCEGVKQGGGEITEGVGKMISVKI
jgi:hypothetical protein